MNRKIRVAAVDYLNTRPLIYGFERGAMAKEIELVVDYPANVAKRLLSNEADIGLVPVAIIPLLESHYLITDYCIGSDGPVASVCLFSQQPLDELEKVYLDYQSRTSVALFRILLKEFWKLNIELVQGYPGFEEINESKTGVVVIGDRALQKRASSKYIYDLGEAWKDHTGLPFVFATWVANKLLPEKFTSEFNKATGEGFNHLYEIVDDIIFPDYDLLKYYTKDIDYRLDESKRKGISLFLEKLKSL